MKNVGDSGLRNDEFNESFSRDKIIQSCGATIEEAQERAEEIGCSGTHQHTEDGQTIYMPCSTHDEYRQRTGQTEADGSY